MGDISNGTLAAEIARCLLTEGRCDVQVQTGNLQAVVDARWAARQAGQLLGRPVRVTTTRAEDPGGGVLVTAELRES